MRVATDSLKVLSFTMVRAGGVATGTGGVPTDTGGPWRAAAARGNSQVRSSPGNGLPPAMGTLGVHMGPRQFSGAFRPRNGVPWARLGSLLPPGGASRRAPVRTISETCPNPSGTLFQHRRARTAS